MSHAVNGSSTKLGCNAFLQDLADEVKLRKLAKMEKRLSVAKYWGQYQMGAAMYLAKYGSFIEQSLGEDSSSAST